MSELHALLPLLKSIPAKEVTPPRLPMAVALQEAHDLYTTLEQEGMRGALLKVGLDESVPASLPSAIAAAREAQSRWTFARTRDPRRTHRARELQGQGLRRELLAACRWNLRDVPDARRTLAAVRDGAERSTAALVQSLHDLATLVDRYRTHFASDASFDAAQQAFRARALAGMLAQGLAALRADHDPRDAKQLRDRAFTHLSRIVTRIRVAGRYAFRREPRRAARFSSPYRRKRRRAATRGPRAEPAEHPPTPPTDRVPPPRDPPRPPTTEPYVRPRDTEADLPASIAAWLAGDPPRGPVSPIADRSPRLGGWRLITRASEPSASARTTASDATSSPSSGERRTRDGARERDSDTRRRPP